MAIRRLGLTRDQLASFLQEHEQIRQFELLFSSVDEIQTTGLDAVTLDAGAALAGVNKLAGVVAQLAQDGAIDAQTALATAEAATSALVGITDAVTGLLLAPPATAVASNVFASSRARYGTFFDTTTQTAAAINTPYAMTLNTTDLSFGVYVGTPTSRVYVDSAGIYNIQFSAQIDKTSAPVGLLWIWLRINGVDVPNSATQIRVQGNNDESVAAWNFVFRLNAGDYIQLMWSVDDTDIRIQAFPAAAPVPAVPSLILTVTDNISR
jgi:hypothetical protein